MLRKAKRLPVIVMLALIAVFLGSLSGCGDSADPLGTGIIQFYDASTESVITSVSIQPGSSVTLVVRVMNLRSDKTLAPVIGERVAFTLMTPGNGGRLTVVNERTTGNGQAMAVYTAGNNSSTDSVRATTSNGATASITITKTGGPVGARISTLAASPTTVAPYQTSVITASVTDGNATPNPIMGEPVTFTLAQNQSDACFINAAAACVDTVTVNTDASGRAVALFRGGGYDPYSAVSDIVRAALANGSTNLVSITRSAGAPLSIAVTASPTTVTEGQASIIKATLTGDNKVGVLVTFTLAANNSGARLTAPSAITDGSGNAVVTYIAGGNNSAWDVSDSVQASVGSISSAVAIVRTGTGLTAGNSITISATPNPLLLAAVGSRAVVTANVTNNLGALSGVLVTFSTVGESEVTPLTATTDASGNAVTVFTSKSNVPGATVGVVTASITVSGSTYTAAVSITNP